MEGDREETGMGAVAPSPAPASEPSQIPRPSFVRRHPLVSVLTASIAALAATLGYFFLTLPDVAYLDRERPKVTSLMQQRDAEAEENGSRARRVQTWVPLKSISPLLIQAVLTGEDANFYGHRGFDLYEIRESVERNWERGRLARGASTITQQLAKNLFLSTEKTLTRKLKEAVLTYRLERDLSKSRILEIYLNVIEWGDGIYGAEAAAQTYFGKSASDLDVGEASLLAALIPNPRRLSLDRQEKSLKVRQERILRWMLQTGKISQEEYDAAKERAL